MLQTPLNPASGLPTAPVTGQSFEAVVGEFNPENRYGDHGYSASRNTAANWVGGWQAVPETQDFTALLGGARIGYNILFDYILGPSAIADTINQRTAKTYNGILTIANYLAPGGRHERLFGMQNFVTAAAINAGGSGYAVGNILTVSGGTQLQNFGATQIEVTTVNGSGAVTGARIYAPGSYTTKPTNAVSVSGGGGSGATFNLSWSTTAADNPEAISEATENWNYGLKWGSAIFQNNAIETPGFAVTKDGWVLTPAIYVYGHIQDESGAPSASSCGTAPSVDSNSSNSDGAFTTGTGSPTACTITLASAYDNAAFCVVKEANAAAVGTTAYVSAQSKSAFTVTLGAGTSSAKYQYHCGGK